MATDQATRLSAQEYLAFERRALTKHEYIDGEVREMTGASRERGLVAGNIYGLLWTALRGKPFEPYINDMRVRVPDGAYYYPDVTIAPSPPRLEDEHFDTLLNPLLIVECLSPSTRRIDRGEKLDGYRRIPSLNEYLIVAQDRVWVDRFVRSGNGWRLEEYSTLGDRIELPAFGCGLALAEIYEKVFPAQ